MNATRQLHAIVDMLASRAETEVMARFVEARARSRSLEPSRAAMDRLRATLTELDDQPSEARLNRVMRRVGDLVDATYASRGCVLVAARADTWWLLLRRAGRVRWLTGPLAELVDLLPPKRAQAVHDALSSDHPELPRRGRASAVTIIVGCGDGVLLDDFGELPVLDRQAGERWRDTAARLCRAMGLCVTGEQLGFVATTQRDGRWITAAHVKVESEALAGRASLPFGDEHWAAWAWLQLEADYADDALWIAILPDGTALVVVQRPTEWRLHEAAAKRLEQRQVGACLVLIRRLGDDADPRSIHEQAPTDLARAGVRRVALALDGWLDWPQSFGDEPTNWAGCESPEEGLFWLRHASAAPPEDDTGPLCLRIPAQYRLQDLARSYRHERRDHARRIEATERWRCWLEAVRQAGIAGFERCEPSLRRLRDEADARRRRADELAATIAELDPPLARRLTERDFSTAPPAQPPPPVPEPPPRARPRLLFVADFSEESDPRPVQDRTYARVDRKALPSLRQTPARLALANAAERTPDEVELCILDVSKEDFVMDLEDALSVDRSGLAFAAHELFEPRRDVPFTAVLFGYEVVATDRRLLHDVDALAWITATPMLLDAGTELFVDPSTELVRWTEGPAGGARLCLSSPDGAGSSAFAVGALIANLWSGQAPRVVIEEAGLLGERRCIGCDAEGRTIIDAALVRLALGTALGTASGTALGTAPPGGHRS